jgi:hypothetical protein
MQGHVEALVLCASAVIRKVERFLDQGIQLNLPPLARASARVFQHAPHNAVGAFAVFGYLGQIAF